MSQARWKQKADDIVHHFICEGCGKKSVTSRKPSGRTTRFCISCLENKQRHHAREWKRKHENR